MGLSDFISVISLSNRDDVQFSVNDSSFNCSLDVFCAFSSKSDVMFLISDDDESLESGSLSSGGLFLNREKFHDFFL